MNIIHGTVHAAARTSVPVRPCPYGAIPTLWLSNSNGNLHVSVLYWLNSLGLAFLFIVISVYMILSQLSGTE